MIIDLPLSGNYMGNEVGQVIGEISEDEINKGRPILSAIVVSTSGTPGEGFWGLAKEVGKVFEDTPQGRRSFW
jgi:hypothetical protein